MKCRESLAYFIDTYCQILAVKEGQDGGTWQPFRLWPKQEETATELDAYREIIILKARQLGFTWLVVAHALRKLIFFPVATVLFFSQRDDESQELVDFRLREMYLRLPQWLRQTPLETDTSHELALPGGSRALAFSTKGGRSYTATLAVIDEADHVENLDKMLNAVQPTIDAGGQLILLSTSNKSEPESVFKKIYRAARNRENTYHAVFHGWEAAPWRTQSWYDERRRNDFAATGSLDNLHQEFPATDAEALSPRSLDKRIPAAWLEQCYQEMRPIRPPATAPAVPGLTIFVKPTTGRKYVLGGDPAEGNPTSDDSAATLLDGQSGEEVAALIGKFEPAVFAAHCYAVAKWYNNAALLIERNNHGHAVLLWLRNFGEGVQRIEGLDGKEGWLTSLLGKTAAYDRAAECFKNQETTVHSFETFVQLSSIDGVTLKAPEGQHDDRAMSYVLALVAFIALYSSGDEPFIAGLGTAEDRPMAFMPPGVSAFDDDDEEYRNRYRDAGGHPM